MLKKSTMKNIQTSISIILALIFYNMAQAQQTQSINLYDFQWKNRLILLFAEAEDAEAYERQIQYLNTQQAGLEDRDLLVFSFFEDNTGVFQDAPILQQDVQRIRKRYQVEDGESLLILIGKDGGEKMRETLPVQLQEVFGLIDQMPMRRREMREKNY